MKKGLMILIGLLILGVLAIVNPPLTTNIVVLIILAGCLIITTYIKDINND